jgi:hypothetical protein
MTLSRILHLALNLTPLFCLRRYDADQQATDAATDRTAAVLAANRITRARIVRRAMDRIDTGHGAGRSTR